MEISITMLKSMIEQVYKIIAKKYINYKKEKIIGMTLFIKFCVIFKHQMNV